MRGEEERRIVKVEEGRKEDRWKNGKRDVKKGEERKRREKGMIGRGGGILEEEERGFGRGGGMIGRREDRKGKEEEGMIDQNRRRV